MKVKNKHRVTVITDSIAAGGGPMGYTYNLEQGYSQIDVKDYKINFIGKRTRDIAKNGRSYEIFSKIVIYSKKLFYIAISDIAIFQGFQKSIFIKIANILNKQSIYMPHSPTIYADEIKMLHELDSQIMPSKEYTRIITNELKLFSYSNIVVFPCYNASIEYLNNYKDIISKKQIFYIKSGVIFRESKDTIKSLKDDKDQVVITFIGRYVTVKGYDIFYNVANSFKEQSNLRFISAGKGPLKDPYNNVKDIGFISDIGSLIKCSDIIVIPNRTAYYDLLPIECASFGKPIILSNTGGNIDQSNDLIDSILFDLGSKDDLYQSIDNAIKKIKANPEWGSNNKVEYERSFTEIALAKRWDGFLSKILNNQYQ